VAQVENAEYHSKSRVWSIVIILSIFMMMILVMAIGWKELRPSYPGRYTKTEILTPEVYATGRSISSGSGTVKLRTYLDLRLSPDCMISNQYFIELSDGSVMKLPGIRWSYPGKVSEIYYEVALPLGAPIGPAKFYIRDTYNCGTGIVEMESGHVPFNVVISQISKPMVIYGRDVKGQPITVFKELPDPYKGG
jgi:hypothetical protein